MRYGASKYVRKCAAKCNSRSATAFQEFDHAHCGRINKARNHICFVHACGAGVDIIILQEDFIRIFTTKTATYESPVPRADVEGLIQNFSALDPNTNEVRRVILFLISSVIVSL